MLQLSDGFQMVESGIVAQYIAEKYSDVGTPLIPPEPEERAYMQLFIQTFTELVSPIVFSSMAAKDVPAVQKQFCTLLRGMVALNACLCKYGSGELPAYFFGNSFTLAEAMTAPFVVRMLVTLKEHRGVDLMHCCAQMSLFRLSQWISAVSKRESVQKSTPAERSLAQIAPYHRAGFLNYKIPEADQQRLMEQAQQANAGTAEAAWKEELKQGNAMHAEERLAEGKSVNSWHQANSTVVKSKL